ncbi:sulfotransferase family 2 domain-containing protein [Alteromonas sp. ASW11-130]|uniref:sulfotransferase family 2 domain-containing protein n=1 Tax=Alteromonas sp. ASW11-130 TaxID=3015775 RepID=UPI002241E645|nr:sulfotransferase family 2 domain-containing protein [Alteromonas sp. ASW11-130]MCW8091277.1 sulfotransferase family protein [Alteromonas sp. ASW11-130]
MKGILSKAKHKAKVLKQRYLDKFIFIHINKTGGSSVEKALGLPFEHETALEKIAELGRSQWDKKFTFAIVRNPWDKVVSHYRYRVKTNQTNLADKNIDFRQWVKLAYGDNNPEYYDKPIMFMPQLDWIADEDGNLLVDEILRFENLSEGFNDVAKRLNINATLPHVKKSKRGNYRDYYDDETQLVVAKWFAKDVEQFNYTF